MELLKKREIEYNMWYFYKETFWTVLECVKLFKDLSGIQFIKKKKNRTTNVSTHYNKYSESSVEIFNCRATRRWLVTRVVDCPEHCEDIPHHLIAWTCLYIIVCALGARQTLECGLRLTKAYRHKTIILCS